MSDFLFAGDVYIDRLTDAGVSTGYLPPIEAGLLSIEETTEIKQRTSKKRDTYGQVRRTVSIKQPSKLKLTLNEVSTDILALALLGEVATRTVSAGTVTDTSPTEITLIPERWVSLPHRNLLAHDADTSPIACATAADTPVTIALSDLDINTRAGMVMYTGSSLTEATACTMTYSYGSESGTRISGGVRPTIKAAIMMDLKNLVDGEGSFLIIDEATLTPTAAVDFASDDWISVELEGQLVTLSDKTSPYVLDMLSS